MSVLCLQLVVLPSSGQKKQLMQYFAMQSISRTYFFQYVL